MFHSFLKSLAALCRTSLGSQEVPGSVIMFCQAFALRRLSELQEEKGVFYTEYNKRVTQLWSGNKSLVSGVWYHTTVSASTLAQFFRLQGKFIYLVFRGSGNS